MTNGTQKINIVPAICTQCSAQIDVDPSRDAAICPHCGTAFIVDKAIENYTVQHFHGANIEHIDTVNINTTTGGTPGGVLHFLDRYYGGLTQIAIEKQRAKVEKAKLRVAQRGQQRRT